MVALSKILIFPIKALPGVELEHVEITQGGALSDDRRWALADKSGRLINGKNNKRVFLLRPSFDLQAFTVHFADNEAFSLDDANGLSTYFSDKLNQTITFKEDKHKGFPDDTAAFGPTVVSEASLEAVASWYPKLSLDDIRARFRINLELSPAPAFWEDQLFVYEQPPKILSIGDVTIQSTNPCARCSVPVKNPRSGEAYDGFYDTFIEQRFKAKPRWNDPTCFDHWYRLSINTTIQPDMAGKQLRVGDEASIQELSK